MPNETEKMFSGRFFIDIYHVPSDNNVTFKPYLTNFSDNYDSRWNEEDVYGRNDPYMTFERTRRTISLGLDMPSEGIDEAKRNFRRISRLANFLYPRYDVRKDDPNRVATATTLQAGPLLKIKFMNFIQDASSNGNNNQPSNKGTNNIAKKQGLLGKIDGFSNDIDTEQGFYQDNNGNLYPKLISIDFEFLTNHTHPLGWSPEGIREGNFPYGEELNLDKSIKGEVGSGESVEEQLGGNLFEASKDSTSTDQQKKSAQQAIIDNIR